jgi:hypothetical protein
MRNRWMHARWLIPAFALGAALAAGARGQVLVYDRQASPPDAAFGYPGDVQAEPGIALNPLDGSLVAVATDFQGLPACGPGPLIVGCASIFFCECPTPASPLWNIPWGAVYTSADGGLTWVNGGAASWQTGPITLAGDVHVAYGPRPQPGGGFSYAQGARCYWSAMGNFTSDSAPKRTATATFVALTSSDDNGLTWSAPVLADTRTYSQENDDFDWLAVDAAPASPYFGSVYVSWRGPHVDNGQGAFTGGFRVAVSRDGGVSFSAPVPVTPVDWQENLTATMATGPDGAVFLAWWRRTTTSNTPASSVVGTAELAISHDGGASFSSPIAIGTVHNTGYQKIPGAAFRHIDKVDIAVDPRPGSATLYATWLDRTDAGGRVVVATSRDGGRTWGAPETVSTAGEGFAFFAAIAVAPTGRVDVGYQGLVVQDPSWYGPGNALADAWLVSKAPGGSWSSPLRVTTVSSDVTGAGPFFGDYNILVSDAHHAFFAHTDARNAVDCDAVDQYLRAQLGIIPGPLPPPAIDACAPEALNTDIYVSRVDFP